MQYNSIKMYCILNIKFGGENIIFQKYWLDYI